MPQDTEEREIAQLFDRWNATLAKGDPTAVAALYARDGMLQPTVSNWMREGRDEITAYFQDFLRKQPQVTGDSGGWNIFQPADMPPLKIGW